MNVTDRNSIIPTWPKDVRLGLAGPVTMADLLPLLPTAASERAWDSNGSPLLTSLIVEYLRRGIQLTVFTTDTALEAAEAPWERFARDGLVVYVAPRRRHAYRWSHGRPGRIVDLFAHERRCLESAMADAAVDLIHAHWSYEYALAAQASGRAVLVTCHDSPKAILRRMPDPYRVGRYFMARRVLQRAGHVTVVSPYLVDELAGWLRTPPLVVPNPIVTLALGLQPQPRRVSPVPRIGMVLNGWGPLKNPIPGMRAMACLRQSWPDIELHLIGPGYGPGEPAQQWAHANRIGATFQFHGRLGHAQTIARIAHLDLLIHPALEESFGLSIAEAMALGVPVVAGRASGAVPWVVGPAAGMLVDVRDDWAIAHAAKALLSNEAAHAAAARAGRARALAMFQPAGVAAQYLSAYAGVAGRPLSTSAGMATE